MSTKDPFEAFKAVQRQAWSLFAPIATFTTTAAASLVNFAGVKAGDKVLDVACGTGVVAITAACRGATVKGLDLAPALIEEARRNAALVALPVEFAEGDAELLPYRDGEFDVVLSQFGHMFAPRPEVAVREMLRVLKPGGRIAFSTWPPELVVGRLFALTGRYMPPPAGVTPPGTWGEPTIVRERLGDAVQDLEFHRDEMVIPALSPRHYRSMLELTVGPILKAVEAMANEPARLAAFRQELDSLIATYFQDNRVRQSFLMSRAIRK